MSSTVWILALIAPISLHHTARGLRCLMISLFYNTVVLVAGGEVARADRRSHRGGQHSRPVGAQRLSDLKTGRNAVFCPTDASVPLVVSANPLAGHPSQRAAHS